MAKRSAKPLTELERWKADHGLDPTSTVTPEKIDRLVHAANRGLTTKLCCEYAGINYKTFNDWRLRVVNHDDSPYKVIVHPFMQAQLEKAASVVERLLEHGTENAKAWQALAWWLERMYRDEFSKPELLMKHADLGPKILVQIGAVHGDLDLSKLPLATQPGAIEGEVVKKG